MHHMDTDKAYREKAWRLLHKNAASCNEQFLEATPYNLPPILKTIQKKKKKKEKKTNKTCWTLEK